MTLSKSWSLSSATSFVPFKISLQKTQTAPTQTTSTDNALTDTALSLSPTRSSVTIGPTTDTELDVVELGHSFDEKIESASSSSTVGSSSPEVKEYNEDDHRVHRVENKCVNDEQKRKCLSFFSQNAFPEDKICIGGYQIFDSIEAIRVFKFLFLTISLILEMHLFTRYLGWEHDPSYTIKKFLKEDLNHVIMDSVSFFFIGRLYKRKGVDRLFPFILPMVS